MFKVFWARCLSFGSWFKYFLIRYFWLNIYFTVLVVSFLYFLREFYQFYIAIEILDFIHSIIIEAQKGTNIEQYIQDLQQYSDFYEAIINNPKYKGLISCHEEITWWGEGYFH